MFGAALAIGGAILGGVNAFMQSSSQQSQLARQKRMAEAVAAENRRYSEQVWNLNREQTFDNLGIQEERVGDNMLSSVAGVNLGLQQQAMQNRASLLSLADSEANAAVAQGADGVRGNTGMQSRLDFQREQFNTAIDLQQAQNTQSVQNMTRQFSYQWDDIGRERESWEAGGYNYEMHQAELAHADTLSQFQIDEYSAQQRQLAAQTPFNVLAGGIQGAASGYQLGSSIDANLAARPNPNAANAAAGGVQSTVPYNAASIAATAMAGISPTAAMSAQGPDYSAQYIQQTAAALQSSAAGTSGTSLYTPQAAASPTAGAQYAVPTQAAQPVSPVAVSTPYNAQSMAAVAGAGASPTAALAASAPLRAAAPQVQPTAAGNAAAVAAAPQASEGGEMPTQGDAGAIPEYYVVEKGDTLGGIAKKFNLKTKDLIALNKDLKNPDLLKPGQKMKLAAAPPETNSAASAATKAGKAAAEAAETGGEWEETNTGRIRAEALAAHTGRAVGDEDVINHGGKRYVRNADGTFTELKRNNKKRGVRH